MFWSGFIAGAVAAGLVFFGFIGLAMYVGLSSRPEHFRFDGAGETDKPE